MPPHPPEEISVLSHRSVHDEDSRRLAVHHKDPLAFTTASQLSVSNAGHKGAGVGLRFSGAGTTYAVVEHSIPSPPTLHLHSNQKLGFSNEGDQTDAVSNNDKNTPSPEIYNSGGVQEKHHSNGAMNGKNNNSGIAVLSYSKKSEHLSISTTLPMMGLHHQSRKGMEALHSSLASMPSRLDGANLLPPSPSMTPIVLLEPNHESNVGAYQGNGGNHQQGHGNYFDQQPHHHHQEHQQQYYNTYQQDHYPRPSSTYYNGGTITNGYQPYNTPYSGNSSPAFPDSPVLETFHSAYSSPVLQHRNYESPQSAPMDLTSHYCSSRDQPSFYDAKLTTDTVASVAPPPYTPTISQSYGLKSSHVSIWKKSAWIVFTMGIFLIPYGILKACFHLQVSAGAWQTSLTYGMLMAADFFAVITFSALNRRHVNQRVKKRDPHWVGVSTGILAVGYREDPVLLEGCLKSLRAIRYQRNQRIMLVVDGNEQQDEYMAQIFLRVFEKQGAAVFRPDFLCMDREPSDKARQDFVRQLAYHPGPVCVMQPHRGKRSAMYTGFAALLQQGIESVVVTDSDTYLDPAVCKELAFALAESPIVGAATGDVRIYNTGTWVSFLSSLRYWFAFNLERGAQSYHSVVNCVSGPLGIYRMSIIADVMDSWVKQSFLGVLCTYGDDRHLTNLVLREGYKVKFTHYAVCYTDTPIRFIAWVTQQTRWSKSFFREIPIQLGCMHLHSPWMTYALLYQLIYPMMMIYNLVNCIYFGTGSQIAWWMFSIMFVGLMKTVYALKITKDKKFFFTTIYGFLYMLGYVPAKIYAALTLYDNSWGTSARLIRNFTRLQSYIAPVTWGSLLFFGVIYNPGRYFEHAPVPEGQLPPMMTDELVIRVLAGFGFAYFCAFMWFFVRTGVLVRDYKRDFSYEELFENMTSYMMVDGGRRKVARFEV
ncbi:Hyaluronan synthase 3 [Linnemannia zychae]|nr:Hyaluronan synthase 3 [Linnemannia zychae]